MKTTTDTQKMRAIKDLDAQIELLDEKRRNLLSQWAIESCPYKVGDIATIRGRPCAGKQCRIDKVTWNKWSKGFLSGYEWTVRGTLLLKDGSTGKLTVCWSQRNEKTS